MDGKKLRSRKTGDLSGKWVSILTHPFAVFSLLSLVALLIYSNSFSVPFQFDDESNIIDKILVRDLGNFLNPTGTRYVGYLSFALNYHFGGLHVFGYHFVNLLIHITNGFLVYSLVLLLFRSAHAETPKMEERGMALIAALLFISHPVQTQAVTYIVQRFASLVTTFYLLAVVSYLKWRFRSDGKTRFLWLGGALLSCIIAMKTKENSFTIPFVILLVEGIFFWPTEKRRALTLIPFLLTLFIIPLSLTWTMEKGIPQDTMDISRLGYLWTQFRVLITYLRLLVFPIGQNLDYAYMEYDSLLQLPVLMSFLFLCSLFGTAIYLLKRSRKSPFSGHLKLIAFGIFWFFMAISVESSIIPIKDVIFEHRLYLPSPGFFMAIAVLGGWVWSRWSRNRAFLIPVCILAFGGFSIATFQRNAVWKDKITLWQDVIRKAPHNPRGHYNLGLAYQKNNMFDLAIPSYQKVITLKADYADAYNNLGNIYEAQGRITDSIASYQQAFTVKPNHAESRNNLANIYVTRDRLEEAVALYEKAVELRPSYAEAYSNLGIAYRKLGRLDQSMETLKKGLAIQEKLDRAYFNLGNTYMMKGMLQEAMDAYEKAIALDPAQHEYPFALGNAYLNNKKPAQAGSFFEKAIALKNDFVDAYFALGNIYAEQGRYQEAKFVYQMALRHRPDFAEVHNNIANISFLLGDYEEAIRSYKQALALKPGYTDALNNLEHAKKKGRGQ